MGFLFLGIMEFYTNVNNFGSYIEYRGYDYNGKRVHSRKKYKPFLYISTENESQFKSIDENPIERIDFSSIKECREFLRSYEYVENFPIYGTKNFATHFIQNYFPNEIKFDVNQIHVGTWDIEVVSKDEFPKPEEANHPIVSIALHSSKRDEYYIFGMHDSQKYKVKDSELSINPKKVFYIHVKDEVELLEHFIKLWKAMDFDVTTGWYIRGFDIPYIVNRIERILGKGRSNELSPWKRVQPKSFFVKGVEIPSYEMAGIAILDYQDLFKKFGYVYGPQENYRLDTIAYTVLGERKLNYDEYGNLTDLYYKNYQKYIDYNLRDTDLVVRMDRKANLMSLALTVAYMAGSNYQEVLGTVGVWHSIIYRNLMNKKTVPPVFLPDNVKRKFPGAYVKEPIPGSYDWIASFDLNSLYPNLIVQFNMSPETFVGMTNDVSIESFLNGGSFEGNDYVVAPNGAMFRKDKQGIIPKIIEEFYDFRVSIQNEMDGLIHSDGDEAIIKRLENEQWAIKILLNSLYGAMSNQYFLYFALEIAMAITLGGQLANKWVEKYVNEFLNKKFNTNKDYSVYGDTDSQYFTLKKYVDQYDGDDIVEYLDEICKTEITPVIDDAYDKFFKVTNSFKNRMVMKREAIASKGIWTAKKRYILNVLDMKGKRYDEPKIKMTGIEAIKSTTPELVREKMKTLFKILIQNKEEKAFEFIDEFKKEFRNLSAEDISIPKSVNNIEKYIDVKNVYRKGTPLHVRASILYNNLLIKKEVEGAYQKIASGDKVRYIYLSMPNPIGENVISFPDVLPQEFGLHDYIDYNLMFEKIFLDPLEPILQAVGYWVEDTISIEEFM